VQWSLSLISEHLDLPPDLDYTQTREFTTGVTAAYTYIRLIIPTIYNSALVSISRFQILQANRAIEMSADVAKVKNVIGFNDASAELQNGTGGTNLLTRVAAVETSKQSEVLQLRNALGLNGTEPITRHPQLTVNINSNTFSTALGTYTAHASSTFESSRGKNPYNAYDDNYATYGHAKLQLTMRRQACIRVQLKSSSTALRFWASGTS
jgi:hypothetical protein